MMYVFYLCHIDQKQFLQSFVINQFFLTESLIYIDMLNILVLWFTDRLKFTFC